MLQLHKTDDSSQEYAEFLHLPRRRFTDFGRPISYYFYLWILDLPCFSFLFFKLWAILGNEKTPFTLVFCSFYLLVANSVYMDSSSYYYLNLKLIPLLFLGAAAVRKEIQDETDRVTGKTKQISPVPIHLSIYSPKGLSSTSQLCFPFIWSHSRVIELTSFILFSQLST